MGYREERIKEETQEIRGLNMKRKKNKQKRKITNEERLRRIIQSQRAIQGYACVGNIDRNFMIG